MANRAGLRKVVKTVRGKHGMVQRSYWVRAQGAVMSGARSAGRSIVSGARSAGRSIVSGAKAVGSFAKAHPLLTAGLIAAAGGGVAYGAHALLAAHGMTAAGALHAVGSYASSHFAAASSRLGVAAGTAMARAHGGMLPFGGHSGLATYKKTLVDGLFGHRAMLVSNNGTTFGVNAIGQTVSGGSNQFMNLRKIRG